MRCLICPPYCGESKEGQVHKQKPYPLNSLCLRVFIASWTDATSTIWRGDCGLSLCESKGWLQMRNQVSLGKILTLKLIQIQCMVCQCVTVYINDYTMTCQLYTITIQLAWAALGVLP